VTAWGLAEPEQVQLADLTRLLQAALGPTLVGIYLYGSAVLGGLRPRSDLDLMVVTDRPTSPDAKRALIAGLLAHSTWPSQAGRLRSVEVTIVVAADVRPWRYPPRMDFQFGGWLRPAFEAGELEPWGSPMNPDLAPLLALTRERGVALAGPPPAEALDAVPRADLRRASVADLERLLGHLPDDTRNILLTLARIWCTLATGEIVAKDEAATWVLERVGAEHREVLRRARAGYLGTEDDQWAALGGATRAFATDAAAEIRRLALGPDGRSS
jgi:streptomycin 3"-adenylyltransferase